MIDDSSLTQVFATVLTGVLIFLTLEGRLRGLNESNKKIRNVDKKLDYLRQEVLTLETERNDLIRNKDRIDKEGIDDGLYKQKVDAYEKRIEEKEEQIQRKRDEENKAYIESIARKASAWDRLVLTKTERIITLSMIVLLSGSIIIMILASTATIYMPVTIQQHYSFISSVIFSAGIILLVIRVYLHGREIFSQVFD